MATLLGEFQQPNNGTGRIPTSARYFGEAGIYGSDSIRNIRVAQASGDALRFSWDINSDLSRLSVFVSIYVDGVHRGSTMGNRIVIGNLSAGTHTYTIILEPPIYKGTWPGFVSSTSGRIPTIAWEFTVDTKDISEYPLYWNSGAGAVSFTDTWKIVDKIEATHKSSDLPDSGAGTGKLSSAGTYTGSSVYVLYHVEIDKAGQIHEAGQGVTFKYRRQILNTCTQLLEWSDWVENVPVRFDGQSFQVGDGLTVQIEDGNATFDLADYWEFTVRARQFYRHDETLQDGTYNVTVRSKDIAGNESANTDPSVTFTVATNPDPPTGMALAAGTTGKLVITGTAPDNADLRSVIIISNGGQTRTVGNSLSGVVPDKQWPHDHWKQVRPSMGSQPSAVLTPAAGAGFSYTTGVLIAGFWEFQAMAVDNSGRFAESDIVVGLMVGAPPVLVTRTREPQGLVAEAQAAGDIKLTFSLFGKTTDTYRAASANIYHDAGGGTVDYDTVVANAVNTFSNTINNITSTISGLADGTTYIFGVRAVSSTGFEESNTTTVSCKSDATATSVPDIVTAELE